ncbi:BTAD domain-containing putative transcriptional regulator [Nocardioides psychrotolerans]|uniref:AfsR/SARP family transcriptional regulator n=1 Tax=Nocardioides psychrotolerans TaxID=1005945 RepID=UPI003137B030
MLHINLLGPTGVIESGTSLTSQAVGGAKPWQVLEILAMAGDTPVSKDRLADLLWEGRPPRSYLGTLESYVCVLRKRLGLGRGRDSALRTVMRGYVLDPEAVTVDVVEFRRLVRSAGLAGETALSVDLDTLERALALVRGPLLAGEPYAAWAIREREAFQAELVVATGLGARRALAIDEPGRAMRLARTAVDVDRLAEEPARLLMQALHGLGRHSEALRTYAELRARLSDELGSEPSHESQKLYLEILHSEETSVAEHREDSREEVRMLVRLLRQALPGVMGPAECDEDRELARVVAGLSAAV